jgi:hypothetical protein
VPTFLVIVSPDIGVKAVFDAAALRSNSAGLKTAARAGIASATTG